MGTDSMEPISEDRVEEGYSNFPNHLLGLNIWEREILIYRRGYSLPIEIRWQKQRAKVKELQEMWRVLKSGLSADVGWTFLSHCIYGGCGPVNKW